MPCNMLRTLKCDLAMAGICSGGNYIIDNTSCCRRDGCMSWRCCCCTHARVLEAMPHSEVSLEERHLLVPSLALWINVHFPLVVGAQQPEP